MGNRMRRWVAFGVRIIIVIFVRFCAEIKEKRKHRDRGVERHSMK